jgi:hypothetical protein
MPRITAGQSSFTAMTMRLTHLAALALPLVISAAAVQSDPGTRRADDGAIALSDPRWVREGEGTRIDTIDGREALRMETGTAHRTDIQLEDGTIDADVMTTRRRSFVFFDFRVQGEGEYEEFYLRPHKSLLPDAAQYAPVYQGQSSWQLYHGAGGTAAPEINPGSWTHVRIVVSGRRAALFVNDTVTPTILVPRLSRDTKPGYIGLGGLVTRDTPGSGAIVHFANLRVRPNVIAYDFGPAPADPAPVGGSIREWTVGAAFASSDSAVSAILPAWLAKPTRVPALPGGLVELHRAIPIPDARWVGAVARVDVNAAAAGLRRLDLGFSDVVTVFLNGRALYHGDQQYSFPNRRDGLIGYDQATVYLPLRAGRNELAVVVSDRFGGWGLMGRFPDMHGLRVDAPR